jgi:hypothetical protein
LEIPHEIRWTLRMRQLTATPRCLERYWRRYMLAL